MLRSNLAVHFLWLSGVKLDQKGRCLDIGAGTGLSGEALRRAGFTGQVDALEPVERMFAQAKKKNIYTEWFQEFLDDKKGSFSPQNSKLIDFHDIISDYSG